MNDMAVMTQALMARMMPAIQGARGLPGLLQSEQNGSGGDAFMQLILQLLGNSGTDTETDVTALMEQMGRMPQMQQDEEEDKTKAAMEMMAEMLFAALPAPIPAQLAEPASTRNAPDRTVLPKELAAPDTLPRIETQQAEAPARRQERPAADNTVSFRQILETQSGGEKQEPPPIEALQFQNTVQEARESLKTQPQPKTQAPEKEIDIEALQADVDTKRFLAQTAAVSAPAEPRQVPAKEVVEQLRTGILENLKADKSEFVVKLKPEGLGEITVKLVEEKGKILLSIVTSSPQVAKVLNQEVTALQNSLRPLQAEVQTITAASEILAGTQYGASDHRFENRQQFTGQHNGGRSRRNLDFEAETGAMSAVAGARMTYDTGLDAYI